MRLVPTARGSLTAQSREAFLAIYQTLVAEFDHHQTSGVGPSLDRPLGTTDSPRKFSPKH
jgi:hypothetical protein